VLCTELGKKWRKEERGMEKGKKERATRSQKGGNGKGKRIKEQDTDRRAGIKKHARRLRLGDKNCITQRRCINMEKCRLPNHAQSTRHAGIRGKMI